MRLILPTALLLALTAGCTSRQARPPRPPRRLRAIASPGPIRVSSPDFADGGVLPRRFTCSGAGDTPALCWSGVPTGTAALAVTLTDSDAPRGTFTHWVVFNLPAGATGLTAVRAGARQATTSAGRPGYTPPCPPSPTHRYHLSVTALRAPLTAPDRAPFARVEQQVAAARITDGEVRVPAATTEK